MGCHLDFHWETQMDQSMDYQMVHRWDYHSEMQMDPWKEHQKVRHWDCHWENLMGYHWDYR